MQYHSHNSTSFRASGAPPPEQSPALDLSVDQGSLTAIDKPQQEHGSLKQKSSKRNGA